MGIRWELMDFYLASPWYARLFLLYLVGVVTTSFVKSVSITYRLWPFGHHFGNNVQVQIADKASKGSTSQQLLRQSESEMVHSWDVCLAKVHSMKRSIMLTGLLSVLVASREVGTIFTVLSYNRSLDIRGVSSGMSAVLMLFTLGVLVCAAMYAVCSFYEGVLIRRRLSRGLSSVLTEDQLSKP